MESDEGDPIPGPRVDKYLNVKEAVDERARADHLHTDDHQRPKKGRKILFLPTVVNLGMPDIPLRPVPLIILNKTVSI